MHLIILVSFWSRIIDMKRRPPPCLNLSNRNTKLIILAKKLKDLVFKIMNSVFLSGVWE